MYEIGEEEINHLTQLITNRDFFRYRIDRESECQIFERELAEKFGAKYSLVLTSGTNALICALVGVGVAPGDEVIIPSYTFVATAIAVTTIGAIPIIANINEDLALSISELDRLCTKRTKAIIAVHMDGIATNIASIANFAQSHGIELIEDAAQAFGGMSKGKRLGTFGKVGCYSFNCDKVITAGEGGAVITDDREVFERMFCMMDASGTFNPANKDFFTCVKPFFGLSMRVSNLSAGILRIQLKRLDSIINNLRERKRLLVNALTPANCINPSFIDILNDECGTTLHLCFDSTERAILAGQRLRAEGILVYPPTMKPAHVCWKWAKFLNIEQASFHRSINPYSNTDIAYTYTTDKYIDSIDIVSRYLKLDMNYSLTPEQTVQLGNKMASIISTLPSK